ncbi:MAG TPA: YtxH domain-containing protein [Anaerolineales bacterium]|nr:YtxH domain-containing protein [Anaerolineales bacterium]
MSDRDDFGAFLIGFVVGGVAGAVAALLLAPQSGEETRSMIKDKSIELRDKAAQQAEVIASRAGQVADDAKSRGKEIVDGARKAVAKKRPAEAGE